MCYHFREGQKIQIYWKHSKIYLYICHNYNDQRRRTNQVNQCICTTTFSAPPRKFGGVFAVLRPNWCPTPEMSSPAPFWPTTSPARSAPLTISYTIEIFKTTINIISETSHLVVDQKSFLIQEWCLTSEDGAEVERVEKLYICVFLMGTKLEACEYEFTVKLSSHNKVL